MKIHRPDMVFLRNILITTDLSEYSLAALEYAFTLGLLFGARLTLLHVAEHGQYRNEQQAAALLEEFAARNIDNRLQPDLVVRTGHAAEQIRDYARDRDMDVIVMATHGRTGIAHALLGSVVQKVVRLSTVPVLTVKPRAMRESLLRFADIEHELHLR